MHSIFEKKWGFDMSRLFHFSLLIGFRSFFLCFQFMVCANMKKNFFFVWSADFFCFSRMLLLFYCLFPLLVSFFCEQICLLALVHIRFHFDSLIFRELEEYTISTWLLMTLVIGAIEFKENKSHSIQSLNISFYFIFLLRILHCYHWYRSLVSFPASL